MLAPEYKKAATALKGVMMLGAIDCSKQKEICGYYNVYNFPTIYIFRNGAPSIVVENRTAEELIRVGTEQSSNISTV